MQKSNVKLFDTFYEFDIFSMGCLFSFISKPRVSQLNQNLTDESGQPSVAPTTSAPIQSSQQQNVVTNSQSSNPPVSHPQTVTAPQQNAPQQQHVQNQPQVQQNNVNETKSYQQSQPAQIISNDKIQVPQQGPIAINDSESPAFGILLCGTGETGKTTFTRQLRMSHLSGITDNEKKGFVQVIRGNYVETMQELLKWLDHYAKSVNEENEQYASIINDLNVDDCDFNDEQVEALQELWEDENIQEAFQHREETKAPDHMDYFFNRLDKVASDNYVPTDEDIIKARIRTIGINAITFCIDSAIIRIYDVGGQMNERQKWDQCEKEIEGIIYCVSLPEFNRLMFEEPTNRMEDSISTFQNMINNKTKFDRFPIFLLFNKYDTFTEKVKNTNAFSEHYPSYNGDPHDPEKCAQFIIDKFLNLVDPSRDVKVYKISALNQDDVNNVTSQICRHIRETYYEEVK